MADLPITQVGAIIAPNLPYPTIRLVAQGASVASIGDTGRVGNATVYTSSHLSINFDFINPYTQYPQRILFNGVIVQTQIGLGDQAIFGKTLVEKGAQSARLKGIDSARFGSPLTLPKGVDFEFDSAVLNSREPYFHFGQTKVITQAGAIEAPAVPKGAELDIAFTIAPLWDVQTRYGYPLLSSQKKFINFNFITKSVVDFSKGHRSFVFGGAQLTTQVHVTGSSIVSESALIKNAADTIRYVGDVSSKLRFGYPTTYNRPVSLKRNAPLNIEFNQALRKTNPLNVPFYFYYDYEVPVQGADSSVFGHAFVENAENILLVKGFDSFLSGVVQFSERGNNTQEVTLIGESYSTLGEPSLRVSTSVILAGALFTQQVGVKTFVSYREQVSNVRGFDSRQIGVQFVSHYLRDVFANRGIDFAQLGTAWISFYRRPLNIVGITPPNLPQPIVGPKIEVGVEGFVATLFGDRIIPESQSVHTQGWLEDYGVPNVSLFTNYIRPKGLLSESIQAVDYIYNLRQYIEMYYFEESELNPPSWSKWIYIINGNRDVTTHGTFFQKIGRPQFDLQARVLSPVGIDVVNSANKTMIADRIRTLFLDAIEPYSPSHWNKIHNDARVITTKEGFDYALFGLPTALKTRRYFPYIGAFESLEMGEAMVADRIRNIEMEMRYSIQPPTIPLPDVQLYTRYVDVIGKDYLEIGATSCTIQWRGITPRWSVNNAYGYPIVKNLTPEVPIHGHDSLEFGDTHIRLEWREIIVDGDNSVLFGKTHIVDRKKVIELSGSQMGYVSNGLTLVKTASPPNTPQYIWLTRVELDGDMRPGFGIAPPASQVSRPRLDQNVVYVYSENPVTAYGSPSVSGNSVMVNPGIAIANVAEPHIRLKELLVLATSFGGESFGKPSLSPHTIWATHDAPKQALSNHENTTWADVDSLSEFGQPKFRITGTLSGNYTEGEDMLRVGRATVELKKRYILADSIRSLRMGWHEIPTGVKDVEQFDSTDTMELGFPVLHIPYVGPFTAKVSGVSSPEIVLHKIELQHRAVYVQGLFSLKMGTSRNDTLYKPQSLHIGHPMPTIPNGFVATRYGTTFISHYVRDVGAKGFDAFTSSYDYMQFAKRVRVAYAQPNSAIEPSVEVQYVHSIGFATEHHGLSSTRLRARYIRPDGNSDQHRKGGSSSVDSPVVLRRIRVGGFDAYRGGYAHVQSSNMYIAINMDRKLKDFGDFKF